MPLGASQGKDVEPRSETAAAGPSIAAPKPARALSTLRRELHEDELTPGAVKLLVENLDRLEEERLELSRQVHLWRRRSVTDFLPPPGGLPPPLEPPAEATTVRRKDWLRKNTEIPDETAVQKALELFNGEVAHAQRLDTTERDSR